MTEDLIGSTTANEVLIFKPFIMSFEELLLFDFNQEQKLSANAENLLKRLQVATLGR